ncbi:MAG: hypothetical protein J3K34DRAFT_524124 [Monoraphidium minutum]|nr:MAG: hypothetical protein J3K34DRAFT_524124 [Monoraphidium minutum]
MSPFFPTRPDGDSAFGGGAVPGGAAAAAAGADSDDSSEDAGGSGAAYAYPGNVFEALPPPPNVGRRRQAAALVAVALVEFSATGGVLWAPLLAALAAIALAPSRRHLEQREAEIAARAAERARADMVSRMPVSPVEAAQWLNQLNQAMWRPYIEPLLLRQCLASLGTEGCALSDFQARGDPGSGRLSAVDCKLALNSDSFKVVVRGASPIAAFTATVSGIRVAGDLRITPLLDQRMLLWGFLRPPAVNVKLAVKGPLGGADLSQFQFIQDLVAQNIEELLVEPRRSALPLDYDLRVEQAVATTVTLNIESVVGLPRTLGRRRAPTALGVTAIETVSRQRGATATPVAVTPGSRSAAVRETIKVELPRKDGIIRLELRDVSAGGRKLGSALLWVASTMDGSTLFWGHDRAGEALARRWTPDDRPWHVALPLEGDAVGRVAEVRLSVAVEPWTYRQPLAPTSYRSPGPHTVVLQVVEARYLGAQRAPGAAPPPPANPFVQLQYDQAAYATAVAYGAKAPVFLETFAFEENPSMLTRRVRLEAWSAPPAGGAGGGGAALEPLPAEVGGGGGGAARREYYGGTAVNLDLTAEGAVQDRWYALGGGEGGEVRVRLAVVAGGPEDAGTQEVLDFCCARLASASRAALLVEVLSSRLQLPLSSIDSDDTDSQPVYRVTYHGATFTSDPVPPGSRRRSRTGRLGLRRRRADGGAPAGAGAPGGGGGAPSRAGSPGTGGAAAAAAGRVANNEDMLARAAFPYAPAGAGAGGAAASAAAANGAAAGAPPPPRRPRRWVDHSLLIECCDCEAAAGEEVMGAVEVDVAQRLALAGSNVWEGWLKLNKDGGHVLVRMSLLPASEPADIVLPQPRGAEPAPPPLGPLTTIDFAGASSSARGGAAAAAPAPVAAPAAGALGAAGAGGGAGQAAGAAVNAVFGALEVDGAWLGDLVGRAQEAQEGLRGRAEAQAQQAASAVTSWVQQAAGGLFGGGGGGGGGGSKAAAALPAPKDQQQQQKGEAGAGAQAAAGAAAAASGKAKAAALPAPKRGSAAAGAAPASGGGGGVRAALGLGDGTASPKGRGGGGGFDMQQALMSALGNLGWGSGGGGGGKRGGAAAESGWWGKVDGERQETHQQGQGQQQQQQQQQPGGPEPAGGGGAAVPWWGTPANGQAPAARGAAGPEAGASSGPGGGGVAVASSSGDAALLSSKMSAAAAARTRDAQRRAAAGTLASFPLQTPPVSSFPLDAAVASHPLPAGDAGGAARAPPERPGGAEGAGGGNGVVGGSGGGGGGDEEGGGA